ncbi:MAG: mechanosensitive ion channel family protein [Actinomycetota bacterium]|nr:mechanosensitive ion channel family protein [Actinomycetota bacterium]
MNLTELKTQYLTWARGKGLEVVLIVLASILLARAVHYLGTRVSDHLSKLAKQQIRDEYMLSERNKHVAAVVQALEWASVALIYSISFVLVLTRFDLPITTLVAPATVVGVALGFGAQRIVQDLLSGFFIFAERQFGVGDIIRVGQPGTLTGISGTVEEVTLRITRLRTLAGEQVILPNSQILQVVNLSRDWSQVVVDFPVRQSSDFVQIRSLLESISADLAHDPKWSGFLVGPITVSGIEAISPGMATVRMLAKTLPAQQWEVGRELRFRGLSELGKLGVLVEPGNLNVTYGP